MGVCTECFGLPSTADVAAVKSAVCQFVLEYGVILDHPAPVNWHNVPYLGTAKTAYCD